jgi:hypothetical protein
MQRVEITLEPGAVPPNGILASASFQDDRYPEPYRLWVRQMDPEEAEDGGPYVIEDSSDADPTYHRTRSEAFDFFLGAVAYEVRQLATATDRTPRDEWLEIAEAVRLRCYGDDQDRARRERDRVAIYDFLMGGERTLVDPLEPALGDWTYHARESGYDRRRNLAVAGEGSG